MQIKLNDKTVKAAKVAVKSRELTISSHPNLVLKVYPPSDRCPAGRKMFSYRYRTRFGIRRIKIGTYPLMLLQDVRERYLEFERIRAGGYDPQQEAKRQEEGLGNVTCEAFAEIYMSRWARPRKRTYAEDERMLKKDVTPYIGSMRMADITRADVVALIDRIVKRGAGISANRTLTLLKRFFGFAVEQGVLEHSPCSHVRAPEKENRRDRVLSPTEISMFMSTLDQSSMSASMKAALQLLLVTAQRRGEVTTIEWEEVDLEGRVWTLPAGKSKNGRGHRVPLSTRAILILRGLQPSEEPIGWVFPGINGHHVRPDSINQALSRLIMQCELPHFTPHDLRRTAVTQISCMGVDRTTLGRILNHADHSTTAIYDRYSYEPEVRRALEKWSVQLGNILAEDQEIVTIRA